MSLRLQNALAAVAGLITITKLNSFALAGRGAGWHLCGCGDAVRKRHCDGQSGITVSVQHSKCFELRDFDIIITLSGH